MQLTPPNSTRYADDPGKTQYLTGTAATETFVIAGNSADYGWGATQDGTGVVVWDNEGGHDILWQFEQIAFTDQTVAI